MLAALPAEIVEAKPVIRRQQLRELAPLQNDVDDVLENAPARSASPQLDVGRYRHYLADYQLTDAQAEEFLSTLWNIILACIDLGMNLDMEAVLTGSAPLEKAKSTKASGVELNVWAAAGFTDTEFRCFDEAGGGEWGSGDGRSAASSSLRL